MREYTFHVLYADINDHIEETHKVEASNNKEAFVKVLEIVGNRGDLRKISIFDIY